MHPNPVFRSDDRAHAMATARDRGFGVITLAGPDGPLASHIPVIVEEDIIDAHFVRSNPIARLLRGGPTQALLIVSGPDSYVSPDWYGVEDQVPTWNYVAIHIRGVLELRPQTEIRGHLERLSEINERNLLPKTPWTLDKNDPETLGKMMKMIVPVRMTISAVAATWKLGQNKTEAARLAAADALAGAGVGHESTTLADLMRVNP